MGSGPKITKPPRPKIDDRVERTRATNANPLYQMGLPAGAAYNALGKAVDFRSLATLANMGWKFQMVPRATLPAGIRGVVPGKTSGNADPASRVMTIAAGGGNDVAGIAQHELGHAFGYEFGNSGSANRAKALMTRVNPVLAMLRAPVGTYRGLRYRETALEAEANQYANTLMNMGGNKIEKDTKIPKNVKITKNLLSGVRSGNSATKTGITKQYKYSGTPAGATPPPWAQGIYGGIPPGSQQGPYWARGIYGGVPTDKIGTKGIGKNIPYYAPHEPIGPTYYPPYQPGAPEIDKDYDLGGLGGGGGGGGGGGYTPNPYGFSMGLINWRI